MGSVSTHYEGRKAEGKNGTDGRKPAETQGLEVKNKIDNLSR